MNTVDLLYLTNKMDYGKVKRKIKDPELNKEVDFYKKRIMQQNLDLLNGKKVNDLIDNSFFRYINLSIQNFKFQDKVDIIQKDYEGIKVKKTSKNANFDLGKVNKAIGRKKENKGKITDNLDIKIKYKNKKKYIMPTKREINLKDESLRTKGLKDNNNNSKKENITYIVDNVFAKKDKKKKKKKKDKKKTTEA